MSTFTSVVIQNIETQSLELILMITEVVQINVENEKDDIIIPILIEAMNWSQTLDHLSPPKVNIKKPGYVTKSFF